jgi:hypothetical protein
LAWLDKVRLATQLVSVSGSPQTSHLPMHLIQLQAPALAVNPADAWLSSAYPEANRAYNPPRSTLVVARASSTDAAIIDVRFAVAMATPTAAGRGHHLGGP